MLCVFKTSFTDPFCHRYDCEYGRISQRAWEESRISDVEIAEETVGVKGVGLFFGEWQHA